MEYFEVHTKSGDIYIVSASDAAEARTIAAKEKRVGEDYFTKVVRASEDD